MQSQTNTKPIQTGHTSEPFVEDAQRAEAWQRDAERMHKNEDDLLFMPVYPRIADGTTWTW